MGTDRPQNANDSCRKCKFGENSQNSLNQQWCELSEVIESDFLISPGDVYPNRKVELEDADIKELCEQQHEAFSKNDKDIGRTQLIEMEIDTGDSLPVVQSPYTLPLKHYDWVRQEIETLEKSGVIERSLSRWVSLVIVVPKKSAPDEPPWRRLCVNYRKVNALQTEVKRTDKGTGCLSLYPLPKIDEMFSKLGGATIFSTIDLRSGYYHIGLTWESRAKSAFVVPMGKWQFKRTPFGLSQAPAYFQLLIDKVLMDCSSFAMGYLDDIIIFNKTEEEHLQHLEEIFVRLHKFGLKMKREKCSFFVNSYRSPYSIVVLNAIKIFTWFGLKGITTEWGRCLSGWEQWSKEQLKYTVFLARSGTRMKIFAIQWHYILRPSLKWKPYGA